MRFRQDSPGGHVLPLSLTFLIPYVGLCATWFLWLLCTARHPAIGSGEVFRLIGAPELVGVTAVNALFLFFLLVDGRRARADPPGLRASHLVGIGLGIAALFGIQLALITFYAP